MSRAVRFHQFGSASVLRVDDVVVAQPGPGRVGVAVRAAGINPADVKRREGLTADRDLAFPAGVGRELAGVIDAVGEGVSRLAVGDEVFGTVPDGALGDRVVTDPANLAIKPSGLDWAVAGGLALVGQTAHDAVASQRITANDTVLVSAAAGGVGVVVCQLARLAGATVVGTAGPANHAFLESLGVIPVLYGEGLVERVREAAPGGITVVFDQQGRATVEAALRLGVRPERINTIAMDPRELGVERVGRGPADVPTLDALAARVVDGSIVLPVAATYPLAEVRRAFEHLESGHVRGKIVVVPG